MAGTSASAPAAATGAFQPGSVSNEMTSVVEMSISARNLRDLDVFSKSDPLCAVFMRPFGAPDGQWTEVQRTECLVNTLNPDFATKVKLNYMFEEQQQLKFEFYDVDSRSSRLQDHDFIGYVRCTLAQIVTAGSYTADLLAEGRAKGTNGTMVINCEELSSCKDEIELQFSGKKLDKKDWFGSSDPFLEFSRSNENGSFTLVHRSEHIRNNVNPLWMKFTIPLRTLCNGDLDRNIKVCCFDHNASGSHSTIGEFFCTARQLAEGAASSNVFECINPKKKNAPPGFCSFLFSFGSGQKKSYKHSGHIHLVHGQIKKAYSFLDYIRGGCELACTISIDFTGSNGDPKSAQSLHYIDPTGSRPNHYELALTAVGEIIEEYDSDKLFPVLGFGARLPPDGRVSHQFFVNGHDQNPYCERVQGVLSAYRSCITRVQLYGPTNFAPTVQHVAQIARQFQDGSQYFILLILTDGIITDMPQTKAAIVEASSLPLSVIIIGVGAADFDAMEELDGDVVRLTSPSGKVAARDIVQFVPFRNFLGRAGMSLQTSRLHLAKEVLAEVPDQFLSFMKSKAIAPNPPKSHLRSLPSDPDN